MEERKAKGSRVKRSAREDRISTLPDALISQILLYLPTKEAVRTCVLSNRWKSVWVLIPPLDLASYRFSDYNAFVSFMDRFLDFSREHKSCLYKLELSILKDENDQSCLTRWIDFVATRKLQHLDVECFVNRKLLEVMPLSLYIRESLLYLRLHRVSLGSFKSVSLPCVMTMCLEYNVYANEACLESLISSCPVLQDLRIVRSVDDNVKVLRVHSQTLTSLRIQVDRGENAMGIIYYGRRNSGVLIDAPRLKCLNFEDDLSESKIICKSGSLTTVDILGEFFLSGSADEVDLQKLSMAQNFFTSLSVVRDMKISWNTFEFIELIMPLVQFCNLSWLEVQLHFWSLGSLPKFLACCPNLRFLVLGTNKTLVRASVFAVFARVCSDKMHIYERFRWHGSSKVLCRELSNPQETCSSSERTCAKRSSKGSPYNAESI